MNNFFDKFLHNVNNSVLKDLCSFQVDIPINERVTVVQCSEISLHLSYGSHVCGQKNGNQLIFPCNIIQNPPTSLACDFVFIGPNNFEFGTKTHCTVL